MWILESVRNTLVAWDKINYLHNYPGSPPPPIQMGLVPQCNPVQLCPLPQSGGWLSAVLMKKWQHPFSWPLSKKRFSKGEVSLAVFQYIQYFLSLQHQPRMNWQVFCSPLIILFLRLDLSPWTSVTSEENLWLLRL